MKILRGRTLVHLLLVLVISVLTVAGCSSALGAPTIPPEETFVIPLEDFPNNEMDGLITLGTGNQSNWYYAALTVVYWGSLLGCNPHNNTSGAGSSISCVLPAYSGAAARWLMALVIFGKHHQRHIHRRAAWTIYHGGSPLGDEHIERRRV